LPDVLSGSPIDALLRDRNLVLVFLPNTNELQRFVWSQAFAGLEREYRLHYVLPSVEAEKILATAGGAITPATSTVVEVPPERFKKWQKIFQAACVHYAQVSPSFALRAELTPDPDWQRFRDVDREDRARLDADFDTQVATLLDGLSPLPAILELLDRLNPLFCVVPTSLLDVFCNDVVWACNSANVPSLVLQSGWDNMSSKGLLAMRPSFLGCWGPQSREHAKIIQRLSPKSLDMLGAPHYELLKPATAAEVQEIRAELGLADGERLILFGGSFRQFDETRMLQLIERAIERGRLQGVKVVYRPHPWRAARQHEDSFFSRTWRHVVFDPSMRERYVREQEEAGFIKRNVPMFDMVYLSRLLSAADAVISPMSTLLVEALLLGKPTMAIAFGDGKHRYDPSVTARMTHFAELRESAALIWCDDQERLVKECARLLREEPESRASARRSLLRNVVTTEPGTYAERLAEFCRNKIELRGRKQRGERAAARRDTISHAYGAHLIARAYCGLDDSRLTVPDYWMHGWIPSYHNVHPALIALHKKEGQHENYDYHAQIRGEKADTMQWVSREDQAEFLRGHGYRHVRAIGLPIVYLPECAVEREPGSLLVLPPHSHKNHGGDDPLAERYAEMIAELRPRFSRIAVGVHEDDRAKGQWVESFRRRGIDVFVTTDQSDPNTLVRLQRLLSSFEYVTTNGYGSHIALAAYCGAKVSVYGPFAEFPFERMKVTHAVKMFPELVQQAYELCTEPALRQHYPFLFVEPDRAVVRRDWAAREVGEPSRVTPAELRRLFGWETAAAPPIAAGQGRPATLVLFSTAHAGFVRNFEDVIAGLLAAGVNVHVQLSKAHHTISMSDYPLASVPGGGRLTHATNDPEASGDPRPGVDRIRVLRDLILYSRPQYDDAVDLRGRFTELQKKSALPVAVQALLARVLRRTPVGLRDWLDRVLQSRDVAAAPTAAADQLIGTLRPDYVVATPVVNFRSREVDVLKAAKRHGIPTLLPVASWDNLTNKGRLHVQPDRIAVWNEAMAREAVDLHGVRREAIWVTGATVFDSWFGRAPSRDRHAFCRELGLEAQLPIVVYLCSSVSIAGQFEGSLVKAWLLAIRNASSPVANVNVVVRPHPMAREPWANVAVVEEDGVARWRRAAVWPLAPRHPTDPKTRAEFFDTIFHADVVVGLNTSAMIEAVILGRPVLTFVGHEQASSQTGNLHFRYLAESGCVSTASSLEEHVQQLAERLGQPADGAAAARFVESFVRPLGRDVSASAALVTQILTELGVAPPARPAASAAEPVQLTSGVLA
jgi:hypothetical protein